MDRETTMPESVQVNIFNQAYKLRSHSGSERVRLLAQLVDERMQIISAQITTHDVAKIAVLAALNIADEMQSLKDSYENGLSGGVVRTQESEAETEGSIGVAASTTTEKGDERGLWFEDIFGSDGPVKSGERLSSQISARLQTLRQTGQESSDIEPE